MMVQVWEFILKSDALAADRVPPNAFLSDPILTLNQIYLDWLRNEMHYSRVAQKSNTPSRPLHYCTNAPTTRPYTGLNLL